MRSILIDDAGCSDRLHMGITDRISELQYQRTPPIPAEVYVPPQLLRQQIAQHWAPDDPAFVQPALGDDERAFILQQLPSGLTDPDRKLRTACGMAVAAIAKFEMSESPQLVQQLVTAIDQRDNPYLGQFCCVHPVSDIVTVACLTLS